MVLRTGIANMLGIYLSIAVEGDEKKPVSIGALNIFLDKKVLRFRECLESTVGVVTLAATCSWLSPKIT